MKAFILFMMLMTPAMAETSIEVDKKKQIMTVISEDNEYHWPVSTAKKGHYTPTGVFYPQSLQTMHYSKKYDNAPMPNSIFFKGDYAIHATPYVNNLGRPASHGCVRLSPKNASILFNIVKEDRHETTITIK